MQRWYDYKQAVNDLSELAPEERLPMVLREWTGEAESLDGEDVRKLFVYAWPDGRGSVDDHSLELLNMLRWIAPVRDLETYLVGTLTIFRAGADARGIRWLLDEEAAVAEMSDGTTLFRATIAASDVLGHFTAGGINEVLVDPTDISVEPVEAERGSHRR